MRGKRLVRYYVGQKAMRQGYKNCDIKTINARHLDDLIRALMLDYLSCESLEHLRNRDPQTRDYWIREIISRVVLAPDQLTIELNTEQIEACKEHDWPKSDLTDVTQRCNTPTCLYKPVIQHHRRKVTLSLALQIKRLDGKRSLLFPEGHDLLIPTNPEPKHHIVQAIDRAYHWRHTLIRTGISMKTLAAKLGVTPKLIAKYFPLTTLSPDIVKRALSGQLLPSVTLNTLLETARYLSWAEQHTFLNLDFTSSRLDHFTQESSPFFNQASTENAPPK